MRTTIDLPDPLFRELKALSAQSGISLKDVIRHAVEVEIRREESLTGWRCLPEMLETEWVRLTSHDRPTPKLWTDAYLSAFARAGGMRIVTLDGALLGLTPTALILR